MFWKSILCIQLLFVVKLFAAPLVFVSEDSNLKKKLNSCGALEKPKTFYFKEKHFDLKEYENVNREMASLAKQNGKERFSQIKCIVNLNLSDLEKEELKRSLEQLKEFEFSVLEYYNRWLFSFEKKNTMTPMDKTHTSEMLNLKFELYSLLFSKTENLLLEKKLDNLEEYETQIISLYHSILKGKFEYYSTITPELRKEILKKLPD